MKVKQIPKSIYQSLKLSLLSNTKCNDNSNTLPVIVSLTTIPTRLSIVHLSVKSILAQKHKPKKIVLWLHESNKGAVPQKLKDLEGNLFEICFTPLDSPHVKLVPSLLKFPSEIIVTCDDDLLYQKNWLYLLYQEHLKNPNKIITNQSRIISYDDNGVLLPYKKWPTSYDHIIKTTALLPIGSAGTLYPVNSLSTTVTDIELMNKLTPKADDLWFKAMSLLAKTDSILAEKRAKGAIPIMGSQKQSLKKTNIGQDKNRAQWLNVIKYFNLKTN
ncbi:zinc-binding alcohol dehydrogenase [Cellulophaga baltica]|uniref:zinc-binding alcohol dehydrogenase n=1 Tax=Cellulophaga TaxID=104264 RepID=UPI001C07B6BD|nr:MULTISPECIES: zinc-binding alcohol dehydrogenase [Cellulophaga]MBU2997862.1 zinc-binding alcohol dehydrogenase [Cellulophaga baltica]MDO6769263.1 zinc-binding alcohol dehydrogenase [Cellulophaga sp. 1_MG-2023]